MQKTCGGRRPSTPTADRDDVDGAKVDTDKAEIDTGSGSKHKGTKKGGVYMLYGGSARGQGGSHLTLTARAPHAHIIEERPYR